MAPHGAGREGWGDEMKMLRTMVVGGMTLLLARAEARATWCTSDPPDPCPTSGSTCVVGATGDNGSTCGTLRYCVENFTFSGGNDIDLGTCVDHVTLGDDLTVGRSVDIYEGAVAPGHHAWIEGTMDGGVIVTADDVTFTSIKFSGAVDPDHHALHIDGADNVEIASSTFTGNTAALSMEGASTVEVHGSAFTDNAWALAVDTSTGVSIHDNEFSPAASVPNPAGPAGITITSSEDVTVSTCSFADFQGDSPAIWSVDSSDVEVGDSTFETNRIAFGSDGTDDLYLHDNSIDGSTVAGSGGISINGSDGATITLNTLTDLDGGGIGVRPDSPSTAITVSENTISDSGGEAIMVIADAVTIEDNEVSSSGGFGSIVVLSGTSAGSITGNSITDGTGGIVVGHAAANFTVSGNTVTGADGDGIGLIGSSAVVQNNSIHGNGGLGIVSAPDFGEDASPSTAGDDTVGTPTIGGSDTGEPNTIYGNSAGGILVADSAATNSATLEDDNSFPSTQANFVAAQVWLGLVEVYDSGNTTGLDGADITIFGDGLVPLAIGTSDSGGVVGPSGYDVDDATTWYGIPEFFVVQGSPNTRYTFAPHVEGALLTGYSSSPVYYSWDGATTGDPTNGFGMLNCITTGSYCRYQVAEIPMTNP